MKPRLHETGARLVNFFFFFFFVSLVMQLLGIISGLKETFIKIHIAKRTNKAGIDLKNRTRKRRVVGTIYGVKYS